MKNVLLGALALLTVTACSAPSSEPYQPPEEPEVNLNETFPSHLNNNGSDSVEILVDPETGCEYLALVSWRGDGYALTPRLNREGYPICD